MRQSSGRNQAARSEGDIMATETLTKAQLAEKEAEAREKETAAAQKEADAKNKLLAGVGTRHFVGRTRGKGSQLVSWMAFDESQPDTLPKDYAGFMEVTGQKDQTVLLGFTIAGYNDAQYIAASDPIAEYVEATWPEDVQSNFRLVVRNFARGTNSSIESAVSVLKPAFVAQHGPKE